MVKISVILPTNKKNSRKLLGEMREVAKITRDQEVFNKEFSMLCSDFVDECKHILYPTLECLSFQDFQDYEVLLCHKYPEDVEKLAPWFDEVTVIKEKSSIWHDLGEQYRTVNNIRNTGLLHAKGELILFLDDMTIFGPDLLKNVWLYYQKGFNTTAKAIRRIRYAPNEKAFDKPNRRVLVDNGVYGVENFRGMNEGTEINKSATWTYCCSAELDECLEINGFDELYDGSFGGTDQDFGNRLARITRKRRILGTHIYEFFHESPRMTTRNDEILRSICGQVLKPRYIKANSWKPNKTELNRYKKWHLDHYGEFDENWDKFMDVPLYNLSDER